MFTLITALLLLVGTGKRAIAQDPLFSQFYANPLYLNPAFAGSQHCTRMVLNYRNQPYPSFGTFSTYSFSADAYLEKLSGGLGINFVHDNQANLLRHTQVGAIYAYHTRLSTNWNVNFGMQAAYINNSLNWHDLVFPDQYNTNTGFTTHLSQEPMLDYTSDHSLDFSAGLLAYNGSFFGGVAIHHLTQPQSGIFHEEKLQMKYTIHLGYEFFPAANNRAHRDGEGFSLSPNLIMQSQSGFQRINYGLYGWLKPMLAGVWFRQGVKHPNSLIFLLGLKQVNYSVGYSYDYSLSGFSGSFGGAHEIGVLLNFNCAGPNMKYRILNCPTF